MARLAKLPPGALDDEQMRLYRAITGGPRGGGTQAVPLVDSEGALEGPFNAMLLNPAIGTALQALGAAIRFEGALPARMRELATLVVAAQWDCGFEQYAHEQAGRRLGLRVEDFEAIRAGREPELHDEGERAAVRAAWKLVRSGDLDDTDYADLVERLGTEAVFELTTLVGYYATLALQLRVFRVDAPES
ncbi:MAG TPA: carboxymuconolactone decarboxylase family protein [Streptosporangiaceae bacterium]|jgi:4-carboxymuconolactone decarboxylase|nr:carboxymuconolactone decarboxylase family protein [Streptosporangiaceae bacterium]